jgi:hypothetical protein
MALIPNATDRLASLRADFPGTMRTSPPKRVRGEALPSPFDSEVRAGGAFVTCRDAERARLYTVVDGTVIRLEDVLPGLAPVEHHDRAEHLVDEVKHTRLEEMEAALLLEARLPESPWSDDYWAIYRGILGNRYGDPGFPGDTDWARNEAYVTQHTAAAVHAGGDAAAIDRLSPAEKYDLLVGDPGFGLTRRCWDEGRNYHGRNGHVETWMGICHGWAPASYMLSRPRKAVRCLAPDVRTTLTFYPADIKALASLLWANARTVSKFIGGRCNDKNPPADENGRIISARCFDTNPATWHLSMVNQIGHARRGLVMDATYDYEVWNQPVLGYRYHYFNPITMQPTESLTGATVELAAHADDKFRKYRSPAARRLVGVVMEVEYVVETSPRQRATDEPDRDATRTAEYYYDLELDASGRLLGGEWYQQARPDFLWTPPRGARAVTPGDALCTGDWPEMSVLPEVWRKAAARTSSGGLPLARIIERLVELAHR